MKTPRMVEFRLALQGDAPEEYLRGLAAASIRARVVDWCVENGVFETREYQSPLGRVLSVSVEVMAPGGAPSPEASESPGRWWRVAGSDGGVWCETSVEAEALSAMRPGDRLYRLHEYRRRDWREVVTCT